MAQDRPPLISIVVPAYNVEAYIDDCLNSIIDQNFDEYEVIVIDDGSFDNTTFICEAFKKNDPRIKFIRKKNGGASSARNMGLAEASGEYVFFVDADDMLTEDCLEKLSAFVKTNPEYDLYINDYYEYYDEDSTDLFSSADFDSYLPEQGDPALAKCLFDVFGNYIILLWRCLYRRSVLLDNKIFLDETITSLGEDYDFFMHFLIYAKSAITTHIPAYYYRKERPGSLSNKASTRSIQSNLVVFKKWYEHYNSLQDKGESVQFMLTDIASKFLFYTIETAQLDKAGKSECLTYVRQNKYILKNAKGRFQSPARIVVTILGLRMGTSLLSWMFKVMKKPIRNSIRNK